MSSKVAPGDVKLPNNLAQAAGPPRKVNDAPHKVHLVVTGHKTKGDELDIDSVSSNPRHRVTCKRYCGEWKTQCGEMTKTATAIVVALLWSQTVTTLMWCVFSTHETSYYQRSYWLGLFLVSVVVLGVIPAIAFKYVNSKDYWAVLLLIEILGHMWGFKVKDIVTYGAYELHHLSAAYGDPFTAPTYSFCNLVHTDVNTPGHLAESVTSKELGFLGYTLDWGSYTHNVSVFDGLYPYVNSSIANATATRRRGLAETVQMPSPAPYGGPKDDMEALDAHEKGPGQVCAFEYRTVSTLAGFRVEKVPRGDYFWELLSRFLIWLGMTTVTVATVVLFRLVYNKAVFPDCCKKMTKAVRHNYTHIQNHLIADAFANAMGWVSAWLVWWILLIIMMLLANLGGFGTSACNGMHAFPLATVLAGFFVFYILVYLLLWGRTTCWKPTHKRCPGISTYVGGLGELQNGFMLGWYLVTLCSYIHTTFIGIYFEEDAASYSPFDDITYAHHTPTAALAAEELVEAGVWTCLGVTYLTYTQLAIKEAHLETQLLKEAKRRLGKYFALTKAIDDSTIAADIDELVDRTRRQAVGMEKRADIIVRAFGIWMGLTIELAIHLLIALIDVSVLEAYLQGTGGSNAGDSYDGSYGSYQSAYSSADAGSGNVSNNSYGSRSRITSGSRSGSESSGGASYASSRRLATYSYADSYAYGYGGTHDYDEAARQHALVFAVELAFALGLSALFFGILFVGHRCSWRISTEKQRIAATRLQAAHRGNQVRKAKAKEQTSLKTVTLDDATTDGDDLGGKDIDGIDGDTHEGQPMEYATKPSSVSASASASASGSVSAPHAAAFVKVGAKDHATKEEDHDDLGGMLMDVPAEVDVDGEGDNNGVAA